MGRMQDLVDEFSRRFLCTDDVMPEFEDIAEHERDSFKLACKQVLRKGGGLEDVVESLSADLDESPWEEQLRLIRAKWRALGLLRQFGQFEKDGNITERNPDPADPEVQKLSQLEKDVLGDYYEEDPEDFDLYVENLQNKPHLDYDATNAFLDQLYERETSTFDVPVTPVKDKEMSLSSPPASPRRPSASEDKTMFSRLRKGSMTRRPKPVRPAQEPMHEAGSERFPSVLLRSEGSAFLRPSTFECDSAALKATVERTESFRVWLEGQRDTMVPQRFVIFETECERLWNSLNFDAMVVTEQGDGEATSNHTTLVQMHFDNKGSPAPLTCQIDRLWLCSDGEPPESPRRHARRRLAFLLPLEESIGLKAAGEFLALDRGGSNPKPGKPHPLCTYSAWGSFAPLRTLLGTGLTDQELLSFLLKCCTAGKGLEMSSGHWFDVCLRQHMFPPTSAALPN
eukprot:m.165716 g.165716  ORF g.165716 m.165716 type:complete len:455 (+) comp17743_c0_seq3:711-2075(+)